MRRTCPDRSLSLLNSSRTPRGFTLIEVLVALGILTSGLLFLLVILQRTLQKVEPVEFETKAALLGQSMLDGIKSDPVNFPYVPGLNPGTWPLVTQDIYANDGYLQYKTGSGFQPYQLSVIFGGKNIVFNLPGDGADNDAQVNSSFPRWRDDLAPPVPGGSIPNNGVDDYMESIFLGLTGNRPGSLSLRDFDAGIELDVANYLLSRTGSTNSLDDDKDGFTDESGDSGFYPGGIASEIGQVMGHPSIGGNPYRTDGDFSYDPQRGLDEELSDGIDNDQDNLIDEDLALASQVRYSPSGQLFFPNGGFSNPYNYEPLLAGNGLDDDFDSSDFVDLNGNNFPDIGEEGVDPYSGKVFADAVDNDGNGQIDEGIDEEIYDQDDDDGDNRVNEDCRAASFPFLPIPFPSPNEDYSFQVSARRVPAGGDRIDNDGDENARRSEGRDYNLNGTIGDVGEGIDEEFYDGVDDDRDGLIDEDVRAYPAPGVLLVTVSIFRGDDRIDNDGDGWIDEESEDGIDNDYDGLTDEDVYVSLFRTTGLVKIKQ